MEETAVIATLPNLEIRVVRRDMPEEGAEMIGVQIKATPSFDAIAGDFRRSLPPFFLGAAPLQIWAAAAVEIWRPWLEANPFAPKLGRRTV